MAGKKTQQLTLKKLKMQVKQLQKKEEQSRNKLNVALKKIKKLGVSYKSKLTKKMQAMKGKVTQVQGKTYAKVADNIQRKLLKGLESKSKAITSAIAKIEKKHTAKLTKGVAKKAKKAKMSKIAKKATAVKKSIVTKAKKMRGTRRRASKRKK